MKPAKLRPKKTRKGWLVNIPSSISENRKRQRFYFGCRQTAENYCAPIRNNLRRGTADQILPHTQSRFASRAFDLLGNRPPEEIVHAVKLWLEENDHASKSITFRDACESFQCAASKSHLTEKSRQNFLRYPNRFPKIANKLLVDISAADLELALSDLPPVAKNTIAAHLSSLWTFSVLRGWARTNPVENVERLHTPKPRIPVLKAKEIRRLFVAAIRLHPEILPLIAIEVFAGVRPTEAEKVRWSDLDFEEDILTVPDHIAKTRIGRHIEMHQTLVAWLDWHKSQGGKTTGTICPHPRMTLRRYLRQIRIRARIVPWQQDVLRHTFASAALSSGWRDIGRLCLELGHSSQKMLHRHYARSIRKKEGTAILSITPLRQKK